MHTKRDAAAVAGNNHHGKAGGEAFGNGFNSSIPQPVNTDDSDYYERLVDEATVDVRAERLRKAYMAEGRHDEGHANCVRLRAGGAVRYCDAFGWMVYTGTHWTADNAEAQVGEMVTETLKERCKAALDASDLDLLNQSKPTAARVKAVKYMLQIKVAVSADAFKSDPNLLNCANGVVNLRTGQLQPHSPDQGFTYCTPTEYRPDADQAVWREWLTDSVGPMQAEYLRLAVGYSLTGHTREEVFFYLYGESRAGKGTFTESIQEMLGGTLAKAVAFGTFTADRTGDTQNFDLAGLRSARFIAASESNGYERLNGAKVKNVTGGDTISAAFKFRDPFQYRPEFKIWLSSNHPVNADPDDDALWGRVAVVHFPHSHLGNEDKALKHRMRTPEALRGILAWAVSGAMDWYALGDAGLRESAASAAMKATHRTAQDTVALWIEECCTKSPDAKTAHSALYASYAGWCRENGAQPKGGKAFKQSLERKGFLPVRTNAMRGFSGIGLLI